MDNSSSFKGEEGQQNLYANHKFKKTNGNNLCNGESTLHAY